MILHTNDEMLTSILNDEYGGIKPGELPQKMAKEDYRGKYVQKVKQNKPRIILEEIDLGIIEFENEQEHERWNRESGKKGKVLKTEEAKDRVLEAILDEVQKIRYIIAFVVVVTALALIVWAFVVFNG